LLLFQVPWFFLDIPWFAKVAAALWLLAAIANPTSNVLAFVALSAIPATLGKYLEVPHTRLLIQMSLATASGVAIRTTERGGTWIGPAGGCFAVVGAASAIAQLSPIFALQPSFAGGLGDVWLGILDKTPWPFLWAALVVVSAVASGWAIEVIARTRPTLIRPLIVLALVSQAAAAAFNVRWLLDLAARSGDFWHDLSQRLIMTRLSEQADVNAAASIFVLSFVAAFGVAETWRRRAIVAVLQMVVAAGLWLTSSRAGMLSALLGPLVAIGWSFARKIQRPGLVAGAAASAIAVVTFAFLMMYPAGRNDTVQGTAASRVVMMKAGWSMFRTAPIFGIGVGQFYEQSRQFVGPLIQIAGGRENAHNNFVQVLAEQGLVGLLALIGVTGTLLWQAGRQEWTSPSPIRLWLAAAVLAAILTWVTGHPLLTPEFSIVFWLFCGLLAATLPAPPRLFRTITSVAVLFLALTLPLRLDDTRAHADLSHRGLQLSTWQHDDEQRYREAAKTFSIFVDGRGATNILPVRKVADAPSVIVRFRYRSEQIAAIQLADDLWHDVVLKIPGSRWSFERVDAAIDGDGTATDTAPWLRVGRVR